MVQPINYISPQVDQMGSVLGGYAAGLQGLAQRQRLDMNAAAEKRAAELHPLAMEGAGLGLDAQRQGMQIAAAQEARAQEQFQAQQMAAQQQMDRQRAFQADMGILAQKGASATVEDYAAMAAKYPVLGKGLMDQFETLDEGRKAGTAQVLGQIAAALRSGNTERAIEMGETYAQAAEQSGQAEQAATARAMVNLAKASPEAALASIGVTLAHLSPDIAEVVFQKGESVPAGIQELKFRAEQAGLEPGTPEYQRFMLTDGEAEEIDPNKPDFETEQKLRKEFNGLPVVKDFSKVNDSWGRVQAAAVNPSPAGDLAMIFNYMKLLDPGSVVRESEFATAESASKWLQESEQAGVTVPLPIARAIRRMATGERLSDEQRDDFVNRAGQMFAAQQTNFNKAVDTYQGLAIEYNLDPMRIAKPSDDDAGGAVVTATQPNGDLPSYLQGLGQ